MMFRELAAYYEKLESISSRLSMIEVLTELFKGAHDNEIAHIVYMTQGVLAPPFEGIEFGLAERLAEESIAKATGFTKEDVNKAYKKSGDMGLAAEELKKHSKLRRMINSEFSVTEVYIHMRKIASASGAGSKEQKIKLLSELIAAATPSEAKYLVRYPLGQLRLGVGDATMLEALAAMATGDRAAKPKLEAAYNICSDLGEIAERAKAKGIGAIEKFEVTLFKPIRPALAERLQTAEEIIEKIGRCAVEHKYDGFRCQIHKQGKKVRIYSRRLENMTEMFPDLVEAITKEVDARDVIFEAEALAFNEATDEFLPFQQTIQRKRKHDIAAKVEELPLHLFGFDIMYLNGRDCMELPYKKRRVLLEALLKHAKRITPSKMQLIGEPKLLEEFFEATVGSGLEGIMAKDINATYTAGARKFAWIKMKRSYKGELSDTMDLVIVGYLLGRGSRAEFQFGGLLCATYNEKKDVFETVSKIGTGFTEVQMTELKKTLDKIVQKKKPVRVDSLIEPDFWVYPKYVVTVKADEITRSPMHTCGREKQSDGTETGYALRFPRIVGEHAIRPDKNVEDATTTKEIMEMYDQQKKVGIKSSGA